MSLLERLWAGRNAFWVSASDSGVRYLVLAGLFYVCLHLLFARWLRRRHISRKPVPLRQMSWEVLFSLRSVAVYGVMGLFVYVLARMGYSQVYSKIGDRGWWWFVISIGVAILMHDTYFYWTHRLMHHPWLFRWMHRTHHLSTNVSPWASYSFSVPEALVQSGIAPVILFTVPMHPLAFWIFMLWQVFFSVFGHCGYELYPRWFVRSWLGRIFNTVTHHSQHHEINRANFSLYFNFWDLIMGTNHQKYAQRFAAATGEAEEASGMETNKPARPPAMLEPILTPIRSAKLQGR